MTTVTPTFIILLIFLSIALLTVKKENVVVPIIVSMCFLPADLPILLGPLHFYPIRVLAILGLVRKYVGGEAQHRKANTIDLLFFSYNFLGSLIYVIASESKTSALINRSGVLVDSILIYIVLRHFIQSKTSIILIIRCFCICILLLLPFAVFEFFSANNLFSILGRSAISTRDGEIRVACTFSHSILFGSFAAALVPVLWADFKVGMKKTSTLLSVFCCVLFVYFSSSSGPIVALASAIALLIFFPWRKYSSHLASFVIFAATFIHFARESPLWHFLYVRIAIKASSTGYHRYLLFDAAVQEFWNWWLLGYGDQGPQWHTKYWPYNHATFTDVTNHYLLEGVRGGFFAMLLFIIMCYKSVKALGASSLTSEARDEQWIWWGFTVMMVIHCISFLSVAYFGQITLLLYLTVAVAAFAYDEREKRQLAGTIQLDNKISVLGG